MAGALICSLRVKFWVAGRPAGAGGHLHGQVEALRHRQRRHGDRPTGPVGRADLARVGGDLDPAQRLAFEPAMGPVGDDDEFPRLVLIERGGSTLHHRYRGLGDDEAADLGHPRHLDAERRPHRTGEDDIGPRVAVCSSRRLGQGRSGEAGRTAGTAPGDQPDFGGELIGNGTGIDHSLVDDQIAGGIGGQPGKLGSPDLGGAGHDEGKPADIVDRLERAVAGATVERRIATHAPENPATRLVHSTLVAEQHDLRAHPGTPQSIGVAIGVTDQGRHDRLGLDHVGRCHRFGEIEPLQAVAEQILVQVVLAIGEPEQDLTGCRGPLECLGGATHRIDIVRVVLVLDGSHRVDRLQCSVRGCPGLTPATPPAGSPRRNRRPGSRPAAPDPPVRRRNGQRPGLR